MTDILYGAQGTNRTTSDLYEIDGNDGTYTSIGPIGFALTGLAQDPTDNTLYGMTSNNSAVSPRCLITVDPDTGAGTVVGSLGISSSTSSLDLAFTSDGQLWGINSQNAYLLTINKSTGAGTQVNTNNVGFFGFDNAGDDTFVQIDSLSISGHVRNISQAAVVTVGPSLQSNPSTFNSNAALSRNPSGLLYVADTYQASTKLLAISTTGTIYLDVDSLPYMDALAWAVSGPPPPPPTAITKTASMRTNGIRFTGTVDPSATFHFDYGLTDSYGSSTDDDTATASGAAVAIVSIDVTVETTYHFRVVSGAGEGDDAEFIVPPTALGTGKLRLITPSGPITRF